MRSFSLPFTTQIRWHAQEFEFVRFRFDYESQKIESRARFEKANICNDSNKIKEL